MTCFYFPITQNRDWLGKRLDVPRCFGGNILSTSPWFSRLTKSLKHPPSTWTSNSWEFILLCAFAQPIRRDFIIHNLTPTIPGNRYGNRSNVKFWLEVFAFVPWRAAAAAAVLLLDASSTVFQKKKPPPRWDSGSIRCTPVSTFTRTEIIRQSCCANPQTNLNRNNKIHTKCLFLLGFSFLRSVLCAGLCLKWYPALMMSSFSEKDEMKRNSSWCQSIFEPQQSHRS